VEFDIMSRSRSEHLARQNPPVGPMRLPCSCLILSLTYVLTACPPFKMSIERSDGFCLTILLIAHCSPSHLLTLPRPKGLCLLHKR
jgi:hypothetical protein